MRSRTTLALMEQLIMVLVFALAAALCVQAFARADRISRDSAARDGAVAAAESMAEEWKSCGGDAPAAAELGGGEAFQGRWTLLYDGDWTPLSAGGAERAVYRAELRPEVSKVPGLCRATVEVYRQSGPDALYTLPAACREAEP